MLETEEKEEKMECTANSVRKDLKEKEAFQDFLGIQDLREKRENRGTLDDQESKEMLGLRAPLEKVTALLACADFKDWMGSLDLRGYREKMDYLDLLV